MGDEHLNTIPTTESDKFIKSCVENLVSNLSESEGENECDVPAGFTTFSNILFDVDYDSDSSDDQSLFDEDLPKKIYSNPLFDEEIIPMKIGPHPFNAESDLHDSSIIISSKIDSLFDEFTGELTLLKLIPPGIDETDCYPEEETHFTNDSRMEEIGLSFNPDDLMPPSIEEDDDDSERDILILEELLEKYSLSLPDNESYHFDVPSLSRPPAKPPDGNTGTLNIQMMGDVSDHKECYLKEVIPFFKTLKEHFEGIQKALTKEMKDVFKELEAEVDQNIFDRKHDEIERKNLLIVNDNLIAECLSKEVFYVETNSELNVSRFTEMHVAHTIVEAHCLELQDELSNLRDKIHNDNHIELVNQFSKLEVHHSNLRLKYQNLKENFGNNPPTPVNDTPNFDSLFIIEKMQASLQGKDNVIKKLKTQISHLQETCSEADRTFDFRALDFQITLFSISLNCFSLKSKGRSTITTECTYAREGAGQLNEGSFCLQNNREVHLDYLMHLKESVETLCEIVEEAKVVRPLDRVNRCTDASGSWPRSNTKKNRISPAKGVNKMKVEEHSRTNKSHLRTMNHVDSSSHSKRTIIDSNLDFVCQTCNKCLISANHDMCVVNYFQSVMAPPSIYNICNVVPKVKSVWKPKQVRQVWKPTGKVLTSIGHQWRPTCRLFTLREEYQKETYI
nr:hypothetical protein [Tanacetum cinerariifolium]